MSPDVGCCKFFLWRDYGMIFFGVLWDCGVCVGL